MEEIWKLLIIDDNRIEVSNLGNVKKNGRHLELSLKNKKHYKQFAINNVKYSVHRIVAQAFPEICGEWFEGCVVDHINTIRHDNRAVNLRVCTVRENLDNPLTKRHMSEKQRGENHPNYGKSLPKEVCEKIRCANMGHIESEETKQKISQARMGQKLSQETKDKISKIKKGHFVSEETKQKQSERSPHKKAIVQLSYPDKNFIAEYESAAAAIKALNLPKRASSNISNCVTHAKWKKSAYDFCWEYKSNYKF